MSLATINDFQKVEIRVGKLLIGPFVSKVLTFGVPSENNSVILIQPNKSVPLGGMVY